MADWDTDNPRLFTNINKLSAHIVQKASTREQPTLELVRSWHIDIMAGLTPPDPAYIGKFRGEAGLEGIGVRIGNNHGTPPADVAAELDTFISTLQQIVAMLDERITADNELTTADLADIVDLCAWGHAEWVRIHPFANGNGRTSRFLVRFLAARYGLPMFLQIRPRPDNGYAAASNASMQRDWQPTAVLFRRLLKAALAQ
jgi:Fic family protein